MNFYQNLCIKESSQELGLFLFQTFPLRTFLLRLKESSIIIYKMDVNENMHNFSLLPLSYYVFQINVLLYMSGHVAQYFKDENLFPMHVLIAHMLAILSEKP